MSDYNYLIQKKKLAKNLFFFPGLLFKESIDTGFELALLGLVLFCQFFHIFLGLWEGSATQDLSLALDVTLILEWSLENLSVESNQLGQRLSDTLLIAPGLGPGTAEYPGWEAQKDGCSEQDTKVAQGKSRKILLVAGPSPKFIDFIIIKYYFIH